MQLEKAQIQERFSAGFQCLFGGRIARTTFVIRIAVLAFSLYLLSLPVNTLLSTSSKSLQHGYNALYFVIFLICVVGFLSAYVKRLHDFGLRGFWAVPLLIGIPAVLGFLYDKYTTYRLDQIPDDSFETMSDVTGLGGILFALGLTLPIIAVLWKGHKGANRFGDPPPPVEHFASSKFNIIAAAGAALILIPTSIYVGLFQSGVWVGRGSITPEFPMIDSNANGRLLAKCWNIKGVGASSGDGDWKGVYRDGYSGSVFDFVIADDGQVDVVPAGATISKAFRDEGFEISSYGLDTSQLHIERNRFMIAAIYDGSKSTDGIVNFTTFSFAKTGEIWPEWRMVMSTGLSQGNMMLLNQNEQARGRLMIGDCMVS